MNYLDLFHGIGGFALGAYWAGMKFEHHYCSDIEPWCQELYAKRFPDSVQLGDITKIDYSTLPKGDWTITGGFPCQPVSIAGKGEAQNDIRWLWPEFKRAIRSLNPKFVIAENVGGLLHAGRTGHQYSCICGWFGRWRWVDMDTKGEDKSIISVSWDQIGVERKRLFAMAVRNMGREFPRRKQGKEKGAFGNILLDDGWEYNGGDIEGNISIFESETSASCGCTAFIEYLESEKRKSLSGMLPFENFDEYSEQDWSKICPSCGRELADSSKGKLKGEAIAEVFNDISEVGRTSEWQDIRASDMGAPHKRERIWIVAYAASESATGLSSGTGKKHAMSGIGGKMAYTSRERCGETGADRERSEERTSGGGEIPDTASEQTRGIFKRGFPANIGASCDGRGQAPTWITEPSICGMADGLPAELHGYEGRLAAKSHQRVNRLRGLGNAIVPQIAEILFRRIFAKTS